MSVTFKKSNSFWLSRSTIVSSLLFCFFKKKWLTQALFILLFLMASPCQVQASDTLLTYVYENEIEDRLDLSDSIELLIDYEGKYEFEDILHGTDLEFTKPEKGQKYATPVVAWARLQLFNASTTTRQDYFSLHSFIDTITVYIVENGQLLEIKKTGWALRPQQKNLLTVYNKVRFSLVPGESKQYYFKLQLKQKPIKIDLSIFSILPGEAFISKRILTYAIHAFYAGVMLLFALMSIFMFNMFRERIFIYFSLLIFNFVLFFWETEFILEAIFNYTGGRSTYNITILQIFISGIVISAALFISGYLRWDKQLSKYFRWYVPYTFIVALFFHIARLLGFEVTWTLQIFNFFILIWIVLTMMPIVLLRKRDKSAQTLFLSIAILVFSAFAFVFEVLLMQLQGADDRAIDGYGRYIFQMGVIIFASILFYDLFDKISTIRTEKQKFQELDTLKSRFFTNISHEFRTPLTLVIGPVQQVMEKQQNSDNKKLLELAHRNAGRLLQLINQLLDLSKLESGKMTLVAKEQNFSPLLKGIVMSFESLAVRKNIRLQFVSQNQNLPLYIDQDKIEKIFYNLLSNAFKFTKQEGEVSVMISEQKKHIEILVRDNGIGIPATRLPYIFNRFYQVDSSETREQEGTGIGLALVKELVELHHGTIHVKSEEGKGTTFFIHLKKGKKHLKQHEIHQQESKPQHETSAYSILPKFLIPTATPKTSKDIETSTTTKAAHSNLPIVLIVDDNEDVRTYIKQHLIATFQIIEAINGQDGIDKALEHLPDLIISDVMMPKKNGYELCTILKTDQRSSHIPIILLTAKAAQEEKLKGLETGADDYLVKPFDSRELEVRVHNLIELRRQLRQRFSAAPTIKAQAIQTNSVDKAFLEKVVSVIEDNFSNEQFSVEFLAKAVNMSRVHLNRKLKALTDQSASKFIQALRLQKALELLQQKKGNVSEIAFEMGFSSTSYFVKCFRDKYGKTPGAILEA